MKNNIVITDSTQFEEIINALETSYNNLVNIFTNEQINIELINETDTWTSEAQKALYGKYTTLSGNYEKIQYSLEVYIKFLKKTLEDYKLADERINDNIEKIENELNVNY